MESQPQPVVARPTNSMQAMSSQDDMKEEKGGIASSLEELLKRQSAKNAQQPQYSQNNPLPMSNVEKTKAATQALSQQAESEFEQWLNKARGTVLEQDASEDITPSEAMSSAQNVAQSQAMGLEASVSSNVVEGNFSNDLAQLKSEMDSIKQLLEHQVSELMWQDVNRKSPVKAMLISKLNDMGLSKKVSEHLAHFVGDDVNQSNAWPHMLDLLKEQLDTTSNEIIARGGVYSLVGPTGVGKTTTIAKLAACYAKIHGADKVGLITTDSFRIGALEQLATYAKILGCPLKQAKTAEELSDAIYQMRNKKLVLIDTAGMSQRDVKLTEKLNQLLTHSRVNIKNYLVLSATAQMSVLQESVQHFKTIPLSGCIFTKIDESLSLGELMSVAIHNRLPIGYLTNGQRVPEDIRVANSEKIVQKANQLFELKQKVTKRNNKVVPKAVGMYD
jgi:flagellar biosynthesis protein FlhF